MYYACAFLKFKTCHHLFVCYLEKKAEEAWSVRARHAATPTMCSVRVPHHACAYVCVHACVCVCVYVCLLYMHRHDVLWGVYD